MNSSLSHIVSSKKKFGWREKLSSIEISDEQMNSLNSVLEIQGSEGNYNFDNYMLGMYNGMELMDSIVDKREPKYRSFKESWRCILNGEKA